MYVQSGDSDAYQNPGKTRCAASRGVLLYAVITSFPFGPEVLTILGAPLDCRTKTYEYALVSKTVRTMYSKTHRLPRTAALSVRPEVSPEYELTVAPDGY